MTTFRIANDNDIKLYEINKKRDYLTRLPLEKVNQSTTPVEVRMAVGAAKNDQDRLATLRNYYPTAIPVDGTGTFNQNYIYFNENNIPTYYNDSGLDLGDLAAGGRTFAEMAGGIGGFGLGGVAGTAQSVAVPPSAPVAATYPYLLSGIAATGAGEGYDFAVRKLFDVEDTRTNDQRMANIGLNVFLNSLPFDKVGKLKNIFKSKNTELIKAAKRQGFEPTGGMLNPVVGGRFEAASAGNVLTVGSYEKAYNNAVDSLQPAIDRFFNFAGGRFTSTEAGDNIITSGKKYVDNFLKQKTNLYNKVDELIPPNTMVNTPNFAKFGDNVLSQFDNVDLAKIFNRGTLTDVSNLNINQLSYKDLKNLRTRIGKEAFSNQPSTLGVNQADLKQLYTALSDDMGLAAKEIGGDAFDAWKAASQFYDEGTTLIDDVINPIIKAADGSFLSPEAAFNKLRGLAVNQQSQFLRANNLGLVDGSFGAALLEDLGKATASAQNMTGEALSIPRILSQTDFKKLPKDVRKIIFNKDQNIIIDDMRTFAEAAYKSAAGLNRSNTAGAMQVMNNVLSLGGIGAAGVLGDPTAITGAAKVAGGFTLLYLSGKGINSQTLRNWAMNAPTDPAAVRSWIGTGRDIAVANGVEKVFDTVFGYQEPVEDKGALEE